MRQARRLRRLIHRLRYTPLHPQWFAYWHERERVRRVAGLAKGRVLDIGCFNREVQRQLGKTSEYWGLDYPSAGGAAYASRPDVFGDAHALPFVDESFDTILLLEVLEHLQEPAWALREAGRVIRPNGIIILSVPFLYPIHDAPYDFRRWTEHGIKSWEDTLGLRLTQLTLRGRPIETAALMANIALAATTLRLVERRSAFMPLGILVPPLVAAINVFAWLWGRLDTDSRLMPMGYTAVFSSTLGSLREQLDRVGPDQ